MQLKNYQPLLRDTFWETLLYYTTSDIFRNHQILRKRKEFFNIHILPESWNMLNSNWSHSTRKKVLKIKAGMPEALSNSHNNRSGCEGSLHAQQCTSNEGCISIAYFWKRIEKKKEKKAEFNIDIFIL